jgi:hypothetical protein
MPCRVQCGRDECADFSKKQPVLALREHIARAVLSRHRARAAPRAGSFTLRRPEFAQATGENVGGFSPRLEAPLHTLRCGNGFAQPPRLSRAIHELLGAGARARRPREGRDRRGSRSRSLVQCQTQCQTQCPDAVPRPSAQTQCPDPVPRCSAKMQCPDAVPRPSVAVSGGVVHHR